MNSFLSFIVSGTPFFPHWLEFKNTKIADEQVYKLIKGKVLETGCGTGGRKEIILQTRGKKITKYVATDYSSWDNLFQDHSEKAKLLGSISEFLFGKARNASSVDVVCSALKLPFKKNTFDTYLSFEVLEHIDNPQKFFNEAHRVLKRDGLCIISVPFLYRFHGEEYDFFRYTKKGLATLAENAGFKTKKIFTYCYFGTTIASMTNQFIVRKILEGNILTKILFILIGLFLFPSMNMLGWIIDSVYPDTRFPTRYHAVLVK